MAHLVRVLDIIAGTSVDGPGLRTSVYFAGCAHHCPECHNPQSWEPEGGTLYDIDSLCRRLIDEAMPVTLTGGDPLFQAEAITELAKRLKLHNTNIWCYTGYTYEEILASERLKAILPYIDVLVDGPYRHDLRSLSILFRGSTNQRLIDVKQSADADRPVLWESTF